MRPRVLNLLSRSELTKKHQAEFYQKLRADFKKDPLRRQPGQLGKGEGKGGPRHLLSSLHDLARLRHDRGELDAASEEMGLAWHGACRTLGAEHPHSLSSAHQLAMIQMSQGLQVGSKYRVTFCGHSHCCLTDGGASRRRATQPSSSRR